MRRPNQLYSDRRDKLPADTDRVVPVERKFITLVSRQTKGDLHIAESRRADITQQALGILPSTSENARRADYAAASYIVTVLGSWLGDAVLGSRFVTVLVYVSIIVLSAILAGGALGALLGFGFVPASPWQVLLLSVVGGAILILVIAMSLLAHWFHQNEDQASEDQIPPQQILVPVREVNPPATVRVEEAYAPVLVPVEEVTPSVLVPEDVAPHVLVRVEEKLPHAEAPAEPTGSQEFVPAEEMYPYQAHAGRRKTDWT
jgi:hypothetical protein